ncbi:hypothetical protein QJS04_geneDACA019898 [Acorus gramineus]|uniref:Uncharacterized protein n=1 Tax=Acorus gramineus TaxID=55184 RepID=A0AAV8ZZE5_ACOGR|nr:hypothetical protein QJS04_geneDACA019898 [Acorus gramineus]
MLPMLPRGKLEINASLTCHVSCTSVKNDALSSTPAVPRSLQKISVANLPRSRFSRLHHEYRGLSRRNLPFNMTSSAQPQNPSVVKFNQIALAQELEEKNFHKILNLPASRVIGSSSMAAGTSSEIGAPSVPSPAVNEEVVK